MMQRRVAAFLGKPERIHRKKKMLRWVIAISLLAFVVIGLLIYISRPEVIEGNIRDIRAPIDRMIKDRKDSKWKDAKDKAWAEWSGRHPATQDCINPRTALKTIECNNIADISANTFEKIWQQRIASGWEPD